MLRRWIRHELVVQVPAVANGDDVYLLRLAFEKLASNGLRHGGTPVRVLDCWEGFCTSRRTALTCAQPGGAVYRNAAR